MVYPGMHHWIVEDADKQFREDSDIYEVPSPSMKLTHMWFLNGFQNQFETESLFGVKFSLVFHGPEKENELLKKNRIPVSVNGMQSASTHGLYIKSKR